MLAYRIYWMDISTIAWIASKILIDFQDQIYELCRLNLWAEKNWSVLLEICIVSRCLERL